MSFRAISRGISNMRRRSFVAAGLAIPVVSGSVLAQPRSPQSTLRFVPQVGLTFLDPIFNIAAVTNYHAFYVFDMLYGLDSQLRPQPQMAKGHTIEDDGHTWVIRLRDGLMFHDGTVVRAVDVVASLKRWAAKDAFGQSVALAVEEWLAPDDYTVKVRLKQPFPLLADALAKPFASPAVIMPERLARTDPATQVTEMVGSGPYRFVASGFDPGNKAVYARFNQYVPREEPPDWFAGGKRAVFDRIEWNAIPDAGTAAAALQAGEIDWWEDVPEDLVPLLQRNPRVKLQASDPTGLVPVLRFNCTIPPFDKPELRRAVLQAVNQQDFMAAMVGGDSGQTRSCFSMFPCNTPYGALPVASGMSNTPDLDTSRAAVRHAGYAGEPVVILSPGDFPELSALSEVAFSLLKELGFKVELAVSDWGSLLKRRASREPVERGGWSLYASYWSGLAISNPAGNALIRGQGKAGWAGWYESAEMETTFQGWLSAPDEAARNDAVQRMEQIAFRDAPTIPLGQVFSRTGFRTSIEGVMVAPAPLPWNVRPA